MTRRDDPASSPDTAPAAEPPFGERFLAELRRLGGSYSAFSYAEIQAIKDCDREGLVEALRDATPLISYAALQRIRTVESPEQLARDLRQQQAAQAAAATVGLFAMFAMIS